MVANNHIQLDVVRLNTGIDNIVYIVYNIDTLKKRGYTK